MIDTKAKPSKRNSEKENSEEILPTEERYMEAYCQIVGDRPAVLIKELPDQEDSADLIV